MKKVILTILLCTTLSFSGCSFQNGSNFQDNSSPTEATNEIINQNCFLIHETNENVISIAMPCIQEIDETSMLLIKGFVASKIEKICGKAFRLIESGTGIMDKNKDYSNYYIEVDSKISYISNELISVVFEGFLNKKGTAHPIHLFFTYNFNPTTHTKVAFTDVYALDEALYDVFSQKATKSILEQTDGFWPERWGNFAEELCSKEEFLNGVVAEDEIYWFHTPNGIGISYTVAYALGDHLEVEIPYGSLRATKTD